LLRLAGVDDQRQARLARGGDMGAEGGALPLPVAMVVIIIEPGLADPDHPLMRRPLDEKRRIDVRMLVRLMGMDADRGPDVRLPLRDADHVVPLGAAGRDVEHRDDAGRAGAVEHRLLLLYQAFVIEVAMAVGEHRTALGGSSPASQAQASRLPEARACDTLPFMITRACAVALL